MGAAVIFSVFVLVGNPLIVLAIHGLYGLPQAHRFPAGLTVAQISEFSLIFIAMGVSIGHLDTEALGLVTLIGLVTIATSTYMITYSHQLYAFCEPWLGSSSARTPFANGRGGQAKVKRYDIILFGTGRFGTAMGLRLKRKGISVWASTSIPKPPAAGARSTRRGVRRIQAIPNRSPHLPLDHAKMVVSSVPAHDTGVTHATRASR